MKIVMYPAWIIRRKLRIWSDAIHNMYDTLNTLQTKLQTRANSVFHYYPNRLRSVSVRIELYIEHQKNYVRSWVSSLFEFGIKCRMVFCMNIIILSDVVEMWNVLIEPVPTV